ncbi:MAG: mycofactocin biosynthesis glycosyltransferase MftF [Frankiaceae bacterium]|nr:mycofactocin biosynthesis glycosyltransferase MftF [Frankiaceae bacterium]
MPYPAGLPVLLDRTTVELGDVLLGGSPLRVMRLSPAGRHAYDQLRAGGPASSATRRLARRLTDAGLAHPAPAPVAEFDVTVVVPARDHAAALDRCLSAIGNRHPVVVVDDASLDADAVAKVAAEHGARLIRRDTCGGPAAARNTALGLVDTEYVAFLDSDCVAPRDWMTFLGGHFNDPLVAAVAPRVVPHDTDTPARRYAVAASALDLGEDPARVVPLGKVSYVPTAALVVRRDAVKSLRFNEDLRYGEDVDLIWRLHAAGHRVRYDPAVQVRHDEPATWPGVLARRFRYGTSAAPLARSHPRSTAPLVVSAAPAALVAGLAARQPLVAAVGAVLTWRASHRAVARAQPAQLSPVRLGARAVAGTALGTGRYLSQIAPPLALAGLAHRRTRLTVASLVLAPAIERWVRRRPPIDLPRFLAAALADDLAYGAGVWAGAIRHRTAAPLRPILRTKERPDA